MMHDVGELTMLRDECMSTLTNSQQRDAFLKYNAAWLETTNELQQALQKEIDAKDEKSRQCQNLETDVTRLNTLQVLSQMELEKEKERYDKVHKEGVDLFAKCVWPQRRLSEYTMSQQLIQHIVFLNLFGQPENIEKFATFLIFAMVKCPFWVEEIVTRCLDVIEDCLSNVHSTLYSAFWDMLQIFGNGELDVSRPAVKQFMTRVPLNVLLMHGFPRQISVLDLYLEGAVDKPMQIDALRHLILSRCNSDRESIIRDLVIRQDTTGSTKLFDYFSDNHDHQEDGIVLSLLQCLLYHGTPNGFFTIRNQEMAQCEHGDIEIIITTGATYLHYVAAKGWKRSLLYCVRQYVANEAMYMICMLGLVNKAWHKAAARFETTTMCAGISYRPPIFRNILDAKQQAAHLYTVNFENFPEDTLHRIMEHSMCPREMFQCLWSLDDEDNSFTRLFVRVSQAIEGIRPHCDNLVNLLASNDLKIIHFANELAEIENRMKM